MSLEQLLATEVRAAVHAALDEREMNAWPSLMNLQQIEARYTQDGVKVLKASTLRAAILSGQLVASKPGKDYLVKPEELRAYLEKISNQPTPAPAVKDVRTRRT